MRSLSELLKSLLLSFPALLEGGGYNSSKEQWGGGAPFIHSSSLEYFFLGGGRGVFEILKTYIHESSILATLKLLVF